MRREKGRLISSNLNLVMKSRKEGVREREDGKVRKGGREGGVERKTGRGRIGSFSISKISQDNGALSNDSTNEFVLFY